MSIERGQSRRSRAVRGVLRTWQRTGVALAWCGIASFTLWGVSGCGGPSQTPEPGASTQETLTEAEMVAKLDEILDYTYSERVLDVDIPGGPAAWQIMHGVLAFGPTFPIRHEGQVVGTVDYLAHGGTMGGWGLAPGRVYDEATGARGVITQLELGSKAGQGHTDQWLGYMAHAGVPLDQEFVVEGETMTMRGMLEQAKWEVPRNAIQEYSWTLMGLSQYETTEATWTAVDGETWSVADLVDIESSYLMGDGPCGGTHRLTGLALICQKRKLEGLPFEGPWAVALERLNSGIEGARLNQNADGSFSTNYLTRGGTTSDLAQVLGTSGHVLEFLSIHMTDEQIREPWVQRAALNLADVFDTTRGLDLECGVLYHAAHALVLYRNRLAETPYQPPANSVPELLTDASL